MLLYLARRFASLLPVFFGITLVTFAVIHSAPGRPTDLDTSLNPKVSQEARRRLEALYGLNEPLYRQYLSWCRRIVSFDFGTSYLDGRPVRKKILERLPVTIGLNTAALALILAIGIPIGILSAVKRGSAVDNLLTAFIFFMFSAPEFWLALLAMSFFGVVLGWLPVSGLTSFDWPSMSVAGKVIDIVRHTVLPVSLSALAGLAGISRYMRSSLVGVLKEEYIRTARAKGLGECAVLFRHAFRNASLPIITILGLALPGLIGGSVIFESIFSLPGMGRLFFESVMARDYPTIMGILSIGAFLTLAGNLCADIGYACADPRIRVGRGGP